MSETDKSDNIESISIDISKLGYDPIKHIVIDEEMGNAYQDTTPNLVDVIDNILRGKISDYKANETFGESTNYCNIGDYSDMPGEEEIAIVLNSIDRKILAEYFKLYLENITYFDELMNTYSNIEHVDEVDQILNEEAEEHYSEDWDYYENMQYYEELDEQRKEDFESSVLREDVAEYYLSKTPEELNYVLGPNVSRMVGFDQKNSHHCYDLWEHTLRTVEGINPEGLTKDQFTKLRIAAFFHDIGKPDVAKFNEKTGQQVFYGHAMHSVDVADFLLENLTYNEEERKQIEFYIGHHDDFISYKTNVPLFMKNHEFVREISPFSVAEKMIENKYNFEKMGYNKDEIRAICYTLANGKEPNFQINNNPIEIPVDMEEVQRKIDSGNYSVQYDATIEDYQILLQLCKADAGAQSEIAIQNDKEVGSKSEKLENMNNIENCIPEAYKIMQRVASKDKFSSNVVGYAKKRVEVREKDTKAKELLHDYEEQMPKPQQSLDED